ncbi:MAG: hypothetical protein K9G39_07530, partial [Chlorobium sp.]|nr:hypothetical protein [Chlorobium sp.]
ATFLSKQPLLPMLGILFNALGNLELPCHDQAGNSTPAKKHPTPSSAPQLSGNRIEEPLGIALVLRYVGNVNDITWFRGR